jgi:hypothetical protein
METNREYGCENVGGKDVNINRTIQCRRSDVEK